MSLRENWLVRIDEAKMGKVAHLERHNETVCCLRSMIVHMAPELEFFCQIQAQLKVRTSAHLRVCDAHCKLKFNQSM